MFGSEVLPIVGLIAAAVFGFLNGWFVCRILARSADLSVDDLSVDAVRDGIAPPSARWANGPRAVLHETRDRDGLRTSHAAGLTAVATFERDGDTQPFEGLETDVAVDEKHVELSRCEARISDLESVLSDLDQLATTFDEVAVLRTRVAERERRARNSVRSASVGAFGLA